MEIFIIVQEHQIVVSVLSNCYNPTEAFSLYLIALRILAKLHVRSLADF